MGENAAAGLGWATNLYLRQELQLFARATLAGPNPGVALQRYYLM